MTRATLGSLFRSAKLPASNTLYIGLIMKNIVFPVFTTLRKTYPLILHTYAPHNSASSLRKAPQIFILQHLVFPGILL